MAKKKDNKIPVMRRSFRGTIEDLEELLFYGHSLKDIESILGMKKAQLEALAVDKRGISLEELAEAQRVHLKHFIRQVQVMHAASNPQIAMFLGKNLLGQRDTLPSLPEFNGELVKVVDRLGDYLEKYPKKRKG